MINVLTDTNKTGRPAMFARMSATKKLIANHQKEFDVLLADERKAMGLPDPAEVRREKMKKQEVRNLENQVKKLQRKIEKINGINS